MKQLISAIEQGRCAIAVSEASLRDADVMLALTERAALSPMALSGPAVSPVTAVTEASILRAVSAPNGILVLVEPDPIADSAGLLALSKLLGRGLHKPTIAVVGKSFNPFAFASTLRGYKTEHIKERGKIFLRDLPIPPAIEADEAPVASLPKPKKAGDRAPAYAFAGRDEEVASLAALLAAPGPIVVSGASGVGRGQIVEHAVAAAGLRRLPELTLNHSSGFDALIGRLAAVTAAHGNSALADALKAPHTPLSVIAAAVEALAATEGAGGDVLIVRELDYALGRDADFFRKSRLELLCEALLTHSYPLRLVFISGRQPAFGVEGAGQHLRRLEVGGIRGKFYHEIFAAYKAPEFPREHFGPIWERTFGHVIAARTYAIAVRDRADGLKLVEDAKFLKLTAADNLDPVKKHITKALDRIDAADRAALATLAHLHIPFDGQLIADLDINRKTRLELLAVGLVETVGTETDRRYRVHPLVRSLLAYREISDFDVLDKLAGLLEKRAAAAEGIDKVALEQEAHRLTVLGRNAKRSSKLEWPDNDALVESTIGMIRSKNPNYEMADKRLRHVVANDPSNADAWILLIELFQKGAPKAEALQKIIDEAVEKAPVPEVFHQVTSYWLSRKTRQKAIEALEVAVVALPNEARLKCRLAALLMRAGRRNEAIEHLKQAMSLAPMLPDPYGLLGMAKRDEGVEALAEAETLLREAVRLAPGDATQTCRLVDLLLALARDSQEATRRELLFKESRELLDAALEGDYKSPEALLLLATLVRESTGDVERANWLLKEARKGTDRGMERNHRIAIERARVLSIAGNHADAEKLVREQIAKVPTSAPAFAALSSVLAAQGQLVPAHAELLRALERTSPLALERLAMEREVVSLQQRIEQQAHQIASGELIAPPAPVAATVDGAGFEATGNTANRTIRRRATGAGSDDVPTLVDSVPAEVRAEEVRAAHAAKQRVEDAVEASVQPDEGSAQPSEEV